MSRLKEFIQIENLNEIQKELRELNYQLLSAMNHTNVVRELLAEKNQLIKQAQNISTMLIPEVRELNAFLGNELIDEEKPAPKAVRRGRPRKSGVVRRAAPKIPKQLSDVLPEELQQKARRRRARKPKIEIETAERVDPLEELRRNLAKLRK